MNYPTRCIIVFASAALCAAGWVLGGSEYFNFRVVGAESTGVDPMTGYEFASTELQPFKFAQLEDMVRADAATRFPNARVELGSVKAEGSALSMTVVFFGNHQAQAFVYSFLPDKTTWKIASAHRLWFVRPSQIARGLRV
ncbi:MAG TPA: hypothetical protein VGM62_05335 [Chthoniobacterales bacterium]|jgi:hypothetical protein